MRTAKVDLGGRPSDMAEGRVREQSQNRAMRRRENGLRPPHDFSTTLVASMAAVWNTTQEEIKEKVNPMQIKDFGAMKGTQILLCNYIFSVIQ
jgi:hypothetical protein